MSFTSEVKKEIALNELKNCCKKAELSALIQLCSTLSISAGLGMTLLVKTENAAVARRILALLKEMYDTDVDVSVFRKMNLKKNNIYRLRILKNVKDILEDLGLHSSRGWLDYPLARIVQKDCCARAYLAGAFMAVGSVNDPSKANYHLEIAVSNERHANFVNKLMTRYGFEGKIIERRNAYVIYLKQANKIGDFLKCIGASATYYTFEDILINRKFVNDLYRANNCEIANEVKTQTAASSQMEDIRILEENSLVTTLDSKLRQVIAIRKKFPDLSLKELCDEMENEYGVPISKSGMKHRFVKIHELALEAKGE
ncbi:MAG: DNA-binding protein WhiA [Erysipelotrichaceae bacterium]|nr:DNA-binding protein WhiA [Erysipelotrichaceae bacterium]